MGSNTSHGSKLIYLMKCLKLLLYKGVARTESKTPLEFIDVAQKEERLDQLQISKRITMFILCFMADRMVPNSRLHFLRKKMR
ncbi:unnamed protein product [Didymodactylos carnosus]|uniref:Uncharacterized protein n=1 Tax=Didymodactylos carnosus TaxID=1234261 RepID=A0A815F0G1_9BILA|nr:unnamed protein product [Didymodactylos carnosus]CAF4169936.1 unnamed protein product [Didymodactylos carnosus]